MAKKSGIRVTSGSGNVFADLGFAEPEEELAKAQLATRIHDIVRARGLALEQAKDALLVRHDSRTAPEMGWAGKQNGDLLALARRPTSMCSSRWTGTSRFSRT